jgi:hypothetical protein
MDPFSLTAGAIGISSASISSIVALHDFINGLREAKDMLQDIVSNLEAIQRPLAALQGLKIPDSVIFTAAKEDFEKAGVAQAVNNCGQACAEFSKKLKKWTENSSNVKLAIRDRLSIGVWNKEKIRAFRIQVQTCQATVNFAINSYIL